MPRAKLPAAVPRRLVSASGNSTVASTSSSVHDLPPLPPDVAKFTKRRSKKAERDERHDITLSLTEVKKYMGGFTRPQDLRASSWYPGGHYLEQRRSSEPPFDDAYHPRTVYLLEARYPTMYGHGRQDTYQRHIGVCLEPDLPRVVDLSNSINATDNFIEPMDNARWPWQKPRRVKRIRWWEDGENPEEIRRQALDGSSHDPLVPQQPTRHTNPRSVPTELLSLPSTLKDPSRLRSFHTSSLARAPSQDDSDSFERRRRDLPTSSWSRPPRPSQDADDNVVPTYYVERKKQRDSISQRKEEEGGLMAELNAGVLSEGLAAETRTREEKIPVELRLPDGTVAHPSGFEPPTAETEFHPVAAKVPTEDNPLLSTVKQPWDERDFVEAGAEPIVHDPEHEAEWIKRMVADGNAGIVSGVRDISAERPASTTQTKSSTSPEDRSKISTSAWDTPSRSTHPDPDEVVPPFYIERKKQRDSISQRKEEEGGLMAELNAGILSDELAAQTRERQEKIPVEVVLDDGTVAHPSGFEPPTPETDFHPVAAKSGDAVKQPWIEVLDKKPGESRGFHSSAVARATEVPLTPLQRALKAKGLLEPTETMLAQDPVPPRRAAYLPTLPSAPFWRPLLTVTLATRPLANSLERLSQGLARGVPYYVAIEEDERKDFASYNSRMRNLQLNRMQHLTREIARRLGGMHGGFVGIRFSARDKGRAIDGDGLADPIPKEKRMVKVGVGEWYPYAEEVKERFLRDAQEGGYEDCIEVFGVDEWGRRTDGKEWAGESQRKARRSKMTLGELVESEGPELERDVD
ncbi:hypothetical protein L226DRAFT_469099 [Lentinus tigrinus ALCF2SS1-7]|uniref:Uncharacterized protein n=1 Tax=Lentinus tigrinus ALCF2SS1-6 TaxID=1328759 RepID=A0A5C2S0E2_9APHY|nr:hypothetical protein L227DRAFT_552886 [Lentinus tigrinus ALCF2SS1-6]RPD71112.1 hypothetical protein L226DRAFT_469099 [Lentinus tigrinus ALCF2SS1-7]